tara:strand:- start:1344 stop:1625 length:282 start_codon:yes stop_codon:yes gene_type:complete
MNKLTLHEQACKTLSETKFTFAKSMPKIPHDWSAREEWNSDKEFEDMVIYIREYGVPEKFWRKTYIYLYANGYKYWTLGNPIETTRIINRVKV